MYNITSVFLLHVLYKSHTLILNTYCTVSRASVVVGVKYGVNTRFTCLLIKVKSPIFIYKYRVGCFGIPKVQGMEKIQGGKSENRFSTLNFGPHERSLNTNIALTFQFFFQSVIYVFVAN